MAQATRTFRVFVSSTFADLKAERNALQQHVFPRLAKLCLAHQSRFQAIDLRWGVREEAALDQRTMAICLAEIDRCRHTSPRPNFLVLLGDRYGWRPVPPAIPADEFDALRQAIPAERDADGRLLDDWYRRDDNAMPAEYVLKTRAVDLAGCRTDEEREAARRAEAEAWFGIETRLRSALRDAAERAGVSPDARRKYIASATEQEIERGALAIPDAREHVFACIRQISGLPSTAVARDFADLETDGRIDADARDQLAALKTRLEAHVGAANVHRYDTTWDGAAPGAAHLAQLCDDVWRDLSRVILEEISRLEQIDAVDRERGDHSRFGDDRARAFTGRRAVLDAIQAYLRDTSTAPLPIVGASGSGKSALLARAVRDIRDRQPHAVVVERYIGATPGSSDLRTLIDGLCREISRAYGADEATIPEDLTELVRELGKRMALASSGRPLIVMLDALDQLSDADRARSLHWLPAELPPSARLIVSMMPGECEAAIEIRAPGRQMPLEPMPTAEASALLDTWLSEAHRRLTPSQRDRLLDAFSATGLPLYLKLAFEEARRWRSSDGEPELSVSIDGIIRQMFGRLSLESNHGPVIVGRSLGYLAAARNGLTEDELIDLLSADDAVVRDFMATRRHDPPEQRLPVVLWSRLFLDLEPYLTERRADGASLLSFYHRQVREAVEATFLAGDNRRARHTALATYFAAQELFERERQVPNLRKLSEQPYQQTNADLWDDLHATLSDFDFLEAKCTHAGVVTERSGSHTRTVYGGVYDLQEDYRLAMARLSSARDTKQ